MPARAFLCRPPEKSGPGLGTVVEGEHLGADDLIGLMALARDDDHIAGAGPGQRALDGSFPVGNCLMRREPARDARHDVGDDRLRRLAPRIIGGDPHVIGEARGDLTHARPFAAIAITARKGCPASTRSKRPGTEATEPTARAMSAGSMPRAMPTPVAARRFSTLCSPTSGEVRSKVPAGVRTFIRMPSAPEDQRVGRTSARPRTP